MQHSALFMFCFQCSSDQSIWNECIQYDSLNLIIFSGHDVIHQLTKGTNSSLYVEISPRRDNYTFYQVYRDFSISSEDQKYKLQLANPGNGCHLGICTWHHLHFTICTPTKMPDIINSIKVFFHIVLNQLYLKIHQHLWLVLNTLVFSW